MRRYAAVGAASISVCVGAWNVYVEKKRAEPPKDVFARVGANPKERSFYVGSTNDMIADGLQTGDIVLFSGNCMLMKPWAAMICMATKSICNSQYSQCGVVVVDRLGVPQVLEATHSGCKLRPYDQRVLHSHSHAIAIKPLKVERTPEMIASMRQFVDSLLLEDQAHGGFTIIDHVTQAVGFLSREEPGQKESQELWTRISGGPNPSANLICEAFNVMGLLHNKDQCANVMPQDWAEGKLPFQNGIEFGKHVTVRYSNN